MNTKAQLRQERAAMATVSQQLASLESMTVGELAEKFREVFGFPTRTRNKPYLRKRVATLAQLRLAIGGIWRACAHVGVSRDTYERAAGGLGIRRGSAALIRAATAQIDLSALDSLGKATP